MKARFILLPDIKRKQISAFAYRTQILAFCFLFKAIAQQQNEINDCNKL
jgi:hypothetical protein